MQQTKSYWRLAAFTAVAGVALAFVGSACTVTTSTDDGGAAGDFFAGAPGAGATATAGAGGATTAGASGASGAATTAGTAGVAATEYECDVDPGPPAGTPYPSCSPDAASADDVCALCIQSKCCTEYEACYAFGPGDQCGYGGPGDMGEITCVQQCIQDGVTANGVFDDTLVGTCGAKCTTEKSPNGTSNKECGQVIGYRTSDLVDCMTMNCQTPCYGG